MVRKSVLTNLSVTTLYIIQETVGQPLPPALMNFFKNNAKYHGLCLPNPDLYPGESASQIYKKLMKQHTTATCYFKQNSRQ